MSKIDEKIEASLMLSSYLETVGYKNGHWEFNYNYGDIIDKNKNNKVWITLIHNFFVLGGVQNLCIKNWNSSDDTVLSMAIFEACINGGGYSNYVKYYLKYKDLLFDKKRNAGLETINSIQLLDREHNIKLDDIPIRSSMGGNGAAMRTGPIGLIYRRNVEKVIDESIISSQITHNYFLGFLGGMVTALFTYFAINNIKPWKWANELIKLYDDKIIHKYYPSKHDIKDLDEYMGLWKKYQETRIPKLKYKNNIEEYIFPENRLDYLMEFEYNKHNKTKYNEIGANGLTCCIFTYDCLLSSLITPCSNILDFDNCIINWESFYILSTIHPGDNDTTGSIAGSWYGAYCGYDNIDKTKMKELEFYKEIKNLINKNI